MENKMKNKNTIQMDGVDFSIQFISDKAERLKDDQLNI